ncbi:hypothetical protein [Desulfobacter latus]|uniref:Uncharacterized protein n=1 Tax=Desulfobacter latus TaxID=2292 RepID=A0A850TCH5_9BACT|nr:hypothetical protein [Desulfobacter latus]NWH06448.1 hypothetical protein [Desulfobacter latus]
MSSTEDLRLRLAWNLAQESRCCPPDSQLFTKNLSEQARLHISLCPLCERRLDERRYSERWLNESSKDALQELTDILYIDGAGKDLPPSPGQLHPVRSEKGGWGPGGRYYNPPVVMVLEEIDNTGLRVAQVSGFDIFAWNHDIPLEGCIDGMVEAWNVYPLQQQDLGACLEKQSCAFLQKVLAEVELVESEKQTPPAMVQFFRHMEMETGLFFGMQASYALAGQSGRTSEMSNESPEQTGKIVAFKPPRQAKILTPRFGDAPPKRMAAATNFIDFVGENGFVCRAVRVEKKDWNGYEITAERTPDREAVYLAILDKPNGCALLVRPTGKKDWTDTIVLKSGQRKRVELHPKASLANTPQLIVWQI